MLKVMVSIILTIVCFAIVTANIDVDASVYSSYYVNGKSDGLKLTKEVSAVKKVHIIFMNHLDVGYSDIPGGAYIANVLNTYFHTYFPRALQMAAELEKEGYVENMVYTTHPWLVSLYLDCPPNLWISGLNVKCPNSKEVDNFTKGVNAGYISWHAGPMNMQTDNMDDFLLEFGVQLSADLDKAFNITRKFRTLSQRDVPGMTQAVIPSLVKTGVAAVSVGVNNRSPPPDVPPAFRWRYGESEILAAWHPGGYPDGPGPNPANPGGLSVKDCLVLDGFEEALCFAFRTDNIGPPSSVTEILGYYEILRAEFPGAELRGSTLENYFEALDGFRENLPIVTKELTDSWIQGIASDPRKLAEYRVISNNLRTCIKNGKCSFADPRVYNSSRFLLKLSEHTWGLSSVRDTIHWSNPEFNKYGGAINFQNEIKSWLGQRNFTLLALEALLDHPVTTVIKKELEELHADYPYLDGFHQVELPTTKTFICDKMKIGFSTEGAITTLIYNGISWASPSSPLAKFVYESFNQTDIDYCSKEYFHIIGFTGFLKPNITINAYPESRTWPVTMKELFQKNDNSCEFHAHIEMVESRPVVWYGAPQELWVHFTYTGSGLDVDLQLFQKTSTRLPEALFFSFTPDPKPGYNWTLSKMGRTIDPHNVAKDANQYQHGVDIGGVSYINLSSGSGLQISGFDTPLVVPATGASYQPYPAPLDPITQPITSMAFNIYNNVWNTNYIYWYPYLPEDANFKARYHIKFLTTD